MGINILLNQLLISNVYLDKKYYKLYDMILICILKIFKESKK